MNRQEIMQEIARLDKEIHQVSANSRVGELRPTAFPMGAWISAVVCLGYWVMGASIEQTWYPTAKWVALGLGLLIAVSALLRTFKWIQMRGKKGDDQKNQQQIDKLQDLQSQRAALQKQLDEM